MSSNNKKHYDEQAAGSKFAANMTENDVDPRYAKYNGFSSRKEVVLEMLQNYFGNCKTMLLSSLSHLRSPSTIIVIIFLVVDNADTLAGRCSDDYIHTIITQSSPSVNLSVNLLFYFCLGNVPRNIACFISAFFICPLYFDASG